MRISEIILEGKWWELDDTIQLYHGTSTAFLENIKENGLVPPQEDFEQFALNLLKYFLTNIPSISNEVRKEVEKSVQERAVSYRMRSDDKFSSVIYMTPNFEKAASYARSYAEHGGELAYDVWSLVKVVTGYTPPPRFLGHNPVVIEVEIPRQWISSAYNLEDLVARSTKVWKQEDEDISFEEFVNEVDISGFEVRTSRRIPPHMITSIEHIKS